MNKIYKRPKPIQISGNATDYTDHKVGKLTVLYATRRDYVHLYWLAKCECGTEVEVRAHQINFGAVDSCGKCRHLSHVPATTMPTEIPYTIPKDPEAPIQGELNLTVEPTPDDAEMAELLGVVEVEPITESALERELSIIGTCITAIESAPDGSQPRIFRYLKSYFPVGLY